MTDGGTDGLSPAVRELLEDDGEEEDLRRIWELLSRVDDDREYDVDSEWEELAGELDARAGDSADEAQEEGGASKRLLSVPRPLAAAAVVALALLGGLAWWAATPTTVSAPPGEQVAVTLPDGSTARLNADSRISYARGFHRLPWIGTEARRIRLAGEAYFSVTQAQRSFRVETSNAAVEVLGTEFTVRSRAADRADSVRPVTEVVVASGRVRVEALRASGGPGSTVELARPGETSRVVGGRRPTAPRSTDLDRATAWIHGGFSMTAAPVNDVLRELERRFGSTIRLRASVVADDTVTLHYGSAVQVEDVLRDLALIVGLQFRRTARGYELYRK